MESHSLLHIVGFRRGATIKQSEMLGQALRKPTWSRAKHVAPPFALPFADDMANYYCCMTVFHLGLKRLLRSLWRADQETKCPSFLRFFFVLCFICSVCLWRLHRDLSAVRMDFRKV